MPLRAASASTARRTTAQLTRDKFRCVALHLSLAAGVSSVPLVSSWSEVVFCDLFFKRKNNIIHAPGSHGEFIELMTTWV